jgi:hypothetical protein
VELLLTDERAQLSGTYRAEYRVPNHAVSAEVSFQFEGDTPAGRFAAFQWTSSDGAKGEVEMALTGPNLLKVAWRTPEFGRYAALASGTAKLIRLQVR